MREEVKAMNAVTLYAPGNEPLPEVLQKRFQLYERMAGAMETRDRDAAMEIMHEHNTGIQPAAPRKDDASSRT
jgi:hypothetical protein